MSENEMDAHQKRRTVVFIGAILLLSILFSFMIYLFISGLMEDTNNNDTPEDQSASTTTTNAQKQKDTKTGKLINPMDDLSASWQQVSQNLKDFETQHQTVIEQFLNKQQATLTTEPQTDFFKKISLSRPTNNMKTLASNDLKNNQTSPSWPMLYLEMQQLTELHQNTVEEFLLHLNP